MDTYDLLQIGRYYRWLPLSFTFSHATSYVPPLLPRVSFEAETVVISDPGFFVLGSAAADLSHAIVVLVVQPEIVSVVGEPEAFALGSAAAELFP